MKTDPFSFCTFFASSVSSCSLQLQTSHKTENMPKIGPYGNETMRMSSPETGILRSMLADVKISGNSMPKPSELHQSNIDFMRFSHKSFGNVYTALKKKMEKEGELVPPDSDESAGEGAGGEFISPTFLNHFRRKTHLFVPLLWCHREIHRTFCGN